jgi:hypothetical protein
MNDCDTAPKMVDPQPRIDEQVHLSDSGTDILMERDKEICVSFAEAAFLDAMELILRDRLRHDYEQVAAAAQRRIIRELQSLDYSKLAAKYG